MKNLDFTKPRHLHPMAALYLTGTALKESLWGILPVLLVILGLIFLFGFLGVVSWSRYRFWVEEGELRVEHGIIFHKKRYIPLSKIQGVELERDLIHRLIGLVKVRVETGGGKAGAGSEASFSALTRSEGEALKTILLKEKGAPFTEREMEGRGESPQDWIWKLSLARLLITGATSGNIGVFLGFLFVIYNAFDQMIPWDLITRELMGFLSQEFHSVTSYVIAAVLLLLLSWLFSIGGAILRYAGFRIRKEGERIIIERGLFHKLTTTLSAHRIQAIHFVEGPLRRPFAYGALYVDVSGYNMEGMSHTVLSPLLRREEVDTFLQTILPQYAGKLHQRLHPLPKSGWMEAALQRWVPTSLAALLLSFYLSLYWPPYVSLLPLVVIPWLILSTFLYLRDGGWAISGSAYLVIRFRKIFSRYTYILPRGRLQSVSMESSLLGRLLHLATVKAEVLSGNTGATVTLKYAKEEEATTLFFWGGRKGGRKDGTDHGGNQSVSFLFPEEQRTDP
ncbi:putative YdbT [[Clostridium] ultunense Esp]|nr:putative YdbT [[Clostridium] ultunense Esp]